MKVWWILCLVSLPALADFNVAARVAELAQTRLTELLEIAHFGEKAEGEITRYQICESGSECPGAYRLVLNVREKNSAGLTCIGKIEVTYNQTSAHDLVQTGELDCYDKEGNASHYQIFPITDPIP